MFIYMTENLIDGKKYIGMCAREDDNYLGSGKIIKSAIKKYGKENFKRIILERCETIEQLSIAEQKWIDKYDAVNSDEFYNLSYGGLGGNPKTVKEYWDNLSPEERSERNKHRRGWNVKGKNNPMYGKSTSKLVKEVWNNRTESEKKEIAKKVSDTRKKLGSAKGKNNPMYGRSAVSKKNLKWYNNGIENIYVSEGTQPEGYERGRITKWQSPKKV